MERTDALVGAACRGVATAGGWLLLALAALITFETLARRFLGFSIPGVDELGGYAVAVVGAFGLAHAWRERAHVRIDIVLNLLPGGARAAWHAAAALGMALLAFVLAWQSLRLAARSFAIDAVSPTPLATPLVLPQGLWAGGLLLFALAVGWSLLRLARHVARRDAAAVERDLGIVGAREEVAEEIATARRRLSDAGARP